MSLLRGLFWLVLFVFFTFCFVVLFEYGTHDFGSGFQKEFERCEDVCQGSRQTSRKAEEVAAGVVIPSRGDGEGPHNCNLRYRET